ncbi:MAG: phytoene desaturase [Elusimicrobiota bacterium]
MNKKKAIVIGSGFGGISAAIRLQAAGFQTTLIEKRDQPGGRAYVYKDKGFTFDAGPTVITAPHCLEELFELSDKSIKDYVEMIPIFPFYRLFWEDGYHFDYSNDDQLLFEQIRKKNSVDETGYKEFLKYSEAVFHEGYEKLVDVPFLDWWSMLRVAPQLAQLSAYRSVYSMVSKYISDPQLRQAFSFHSLLVGGNPFSSSAIYTLIHCLERKWGVFFPAGGTGALVQGLIRLFKDLGGEFHLNSPVEKIKTSHGLVSGVDLKSGDFFPADLVVSNADVVHTYRDLLKDEKQIASTSSKVQKMRHSMSLFLIYFGTNKKYPNLAHHNVIFGPRYKELLKDIFSRGVLADDFSLYLHVPSVTDPSLAPAGSEAFYVLSPVPHLEKGKIDWGRQGPIYAKKILDYLEARYMPDLKKHIVTQRIFTPLDFKTELNAHWGSAFSLEPILTQSAYFRTKNRDQNISNLYFVGAGTHPGAGIPGVVNSAKATVNLILKDYGLSNRSSYLRTAHHAGV